MTKGNPGDDQQTGHEQTAIGVRRALRQRDSEKSSAQVKEHRGPNRSAKKPFDNHIRSRYIEQKRSWLCWML